MSGLACLEAYLYGVLLAHASLVQCVLPASGGVPGACLMGCMSLCCVGVVPIFD